MKIVHAAFWTAAFASSLMTLALVIPFWLGRKDENENGATQLHGVFYNLKCSDTTFCEAYASVLNSDQVPLIGREWRVNIVAIPVLTVLACITCFLAVTILEILNCRCCRRVRTRMVLIFVTVLLIFSAFFTVLAFFIGVHASDEYYRDDKINHVQEFPWSLMLWALALVLVIIAAVLFIIIVCKWQKYKDHYGYQIMWDRSFDSGSRDGKYGRYSFARSKSSSYGYVPHREGGFTSVASIAPSLSENNLYNFHYLSKSSNTGNSILKSSGRSIYDSPKLRPANRSVVIPARISDLRSSTSYDEFLDSVSQSGVDRPYGRFASKADVHRLSDVMDPTRLPSRPISYREELSTGKPVIIASSR